MMANEPLPRGWPAGRSLAISVNVMVEGWSDGAAPGIGPMGNPLKPGILDLQARSWADYGPRAGAWRLLDILGAKNARAMFYVSGLVAERYPELLRAIAAAGHGIGAHGWAQDIIPGTQSSEDEAAHLTRCISVLEKTTGLRPRGWLSPRCTPSSGTTALLAREGFAWQADFFDRDLPNIEYTETGPILAMPFTMELNDLPLTIRHGNEPETYPRILEEIITNWPELGGRAACIDITVHAHIFGRPAGAVEFARSLEVARRDWAWLTDHHTIARLWIPQI